LPMPRCQVMSWCVVGALLRNQRIGDAKPSLSNFESWGNVSREQPDP